MKAVAVTLVVGLAGCGAAPEAAPALPRAAPTAAPIAPAEARPRAIAVARGLDLYEASHGSPFVGHVDEGEVLDWRGDGFLRVRVGDKELAGYPAPLRREKGAGIGLYAMRDVPLRTADATVVGTALRGAFVLVRRVEDTRVEVALDKGEAVVSADRAAFTTSREEPTARTPRGRVVENLHATLVAGSFRATLRCEDTIEARDDGTVAVVRDGIELVGKATDVTACRPRVLRRDRHGGEPEVPTGWVRLGATRVTAFATKRTFWFEGEGGCTSELFTPGARGGTLEHTEKVTSPFGDADPAQGWTATYREELRGTRPLLTKPTEIELVDGKTVYRDPRGKVGEPPGHGEGIALCGNPRWLVVGQDEGGVQVLADTSEDAVAYRPEDVSVWYTSAEACGRAVARRAELAKKDPLAAARPSVGCGR